MAAEMDPVVTVNIESRTITSPKGSVKVRPQIAELMALYAERPEGVEHDVAIRYLFGGRAYQRYANPRQLLKRLIGQARGRLAPIGLEIETITAPIGKYRLHALKEVANA